MSDQFLSLDADCYQRESLALIPLYGDLFSLVDAQDADLARFKWYRFEGNSTLYSKGKVDGKHLFLHRVIAARMGITGLVDHKNRRGLDNRRCNLRQATHSQNTSNSGPRRNGTSGFKGVSRWGDRWQAGIKIDGRRRGLGHFFSKEEAARAYDAAAKTLFGEFAYLNFPEAP